MTDLTDEQHPVLTDADEVLFRQLNPNWVQDGRPTSQLFKPTPKDEGKPSVDRSSKCDAQSSYDSHRALGYTSAAVYGVSVGEVGSVHGLTAHDSPRPDEGKPAHAHIDMTPLSSAKRNAAAGALRDLAVERGVLHPAVEDS